MGKDQPEQIVHAHCTKAADKDKWKFEQKNNNEHLKSGEHMREKRIWRPKKRWYSQPSISVNGEYSHC